MDGRYYLRTRVNYAEATTSSSTGATLPQLPMDVDGDYWEKPGTMWTRYHNNFRHGHYRPAEDPVGGPEPNYLDDRRVTLKHHQEDDSAGHVGDSSKDDLKDDTTDRGWTGRAVFYELGSYPFSVLPRRDGGTQASSTSPYSDRSGCGMK